MRFLFIIALCWPSTLLAKPNVLFILVDDMGYGDLSCYGAPDAKTPRIDRLASEGVRFTQYYASGAECTPTRTALLTGRYPQRCKGLECAIGTGNVGRYDDAMAQAEKNQLGLPVDRALLPRVFKEAGYVTGIFGKWHLGYEKHFLPKHYGFDQFFGILGGNCDYFTHRELSEIPVLYRQDQPTEAEGYLTHLITNEALAFMREHQEKPFFLYVPYTTPHFPFQTPNDKNKKVTAENFTKGSRKDYVAMLEDLDVEVGKLLDELTTLGQAENTLVIFGSDHGAMEPGSNAPFRGFKGGLFEGGIRTAMMARWPGKLPGGLVSEQPCITTDITYSLSRIAGGGTKNLDGMDILKHLEDRKPSRPRTLHWRARRGERTWKAIRHHNMKYVHKVQGAETEEWLFDLKVDSAESNNLLTGQPELAKALKARLKVWENEMSGEH